MLRIIRTGLCAEELSSLTEQIKNIIASKRKCYLIVPEQDTVMRESAMSKALSPDAPLFFEVTNFTRFANSTFRTLGGISGDYCDKGKKALIMWRAVAELAPTLSMTSTRREISHGVVESAMAAVGELQAAGISPEDLISAASLEELNTDRRLASKISDLSSIYTLYKKLLTERYSDTGDDYVIMNKKLSEHPDFLCECDIFIDGFTSFTEPQYKLIGQLAARCSVTVVLPLPKGAEEMFEYTEPAGALEALKRIARKSGADLQIKYEIERQSNPESIAFISDTLWSKSRLNGNITLQNPDEMRIFEAGTPFDMCEFVAEDIKRRVMLGASYSDFAIIAREADGYRGIIDNALSDAGVPGFLSFGRDVGEFEAIKLIYTAYSAIRSHFSREDVITYAKCGLVGISREACDEFEMYVNTWQLSGGAFINDEPWGMNPGGYAPVRVEISEKLLRINKTRDDLIAPLRAFEESARSASTVKEQAEALLSFMLRLDLEALLETRAEKLFALGERDQAEENLRLWGMICDTLDTMVEVSGDCPCDADGFLGQFKLLVSGMQIGKIPSFTDQVTVGSADMLRLRGKKHVYIIGANAGEMPRAAGDCSYFSERDKEKLSLVGLPISPDAEKKNARELFIISRAIAYAGETVTLLYCRTNSRFKAVEPSPFIGRITELTGGIVKPVSIDSLTAEEKIYSVESALRQSPEKAGESYSDLCAALCKVGQSSRLIIGEGDISSGRLQLGESICKDAYSGRINLTQTRIDSFNGCPMAYFCKYTLGLKEEEIASIDASGIGSFIHAILENFFNEVTERGIPVGDLTGEDKQKITLSSAKKYIASLGESPSDTSPLTRIKLQRLCRAAMPVVDGLCEELKQSKFVPKLFELKIGDGMDDTPAAMSLITDGGHRVAVRGTVDRVDTFEKDGKIYVRVLDYKTGSKTFSPEDMAEGRNLQMFIYLGAILDSKNPAFLHRLGSDECELIPAGVIYAKTSVADKRVPHADDELAEEMVKEQLTREGMVLDNEESISAMGLRYTPLYSQKKPMEIPESKRKYMYDSEGFRIIMETVRASVADTADRIASGDASATPRMDEGKTMHCDYCSYSPICRSSKAK